MCELAPSILAADFKRLGAQIGEVERAGVRYLHFDVMDGRFVPSISFGLPVLASIREAASLFFDVHLMIEEPSRYLEDFCAAGANGITVHAEACTHLHRTVAKIKELGCKAGVALNPATPPEVLSYLLPELDLVLVMSVNPGFGGQTLIPSSLQKLCRLREMTEACGCAPRIEVDGGVTVQNVKEITAAGADLIVSGSAVFHGDITENIRAFQRAM